MSNQSGEALLSRARSAKKGMQAWQVTLQKGFKYCLNGEDGFNNQTRGAMKGSNVFDSTAPDAVDVWAKRTAHALGLGTAKMVKLVPGPKMNAEDAENPAILAQLEETRKIIYGEIMRSNLYTEAFPALKQASVSTGVLMLHEGPDHQPLINEAIPLYQVSLSEGPFGTIQNFYREFSKPLSVLKADWPSATWSKDVEEAAKKEPDIGILVIDATEVKVGKLGEPNKFIYQVVEASTGHVAFTETSSSSRWVAFRVERDAGEILGRGRALRNLPDILTLNKTVELTLQNMAFAVTGIWQADDDGVLNPANIKLVPGAIIPKAVGSQGLQPLAPATQFHLAWEFIKNSQLRIKRSIEGPSRAPVEAGVRSATEHILDDKDIAVLSMAENARLFQEFIVPYFKRAAAILQKKGRLGEIDLENGTVEIQQVSPFTEMMKSAENAERMQGLERASAFGASYIDAVMDVPKATRKALSDAGWADDELRTAEETAQRLKAMSQASQQPAPERV